MSDTILDEPIKASTSKKLYKDNSMWIATFLGGPLAGAYLMAENFKTLGEESKVMATWLTGVLSTLVIAISIMMIPDTVRIPNQVIPIVYTAIAASLFNKYLGKKVKTHVENGGLVYSAWRAVLVGLISLIVVIVIIVALVLVFDLFG